MSGSTRPRRELLPIALAGTYRSRRQLVGPGVRLRVASVIQCGRSSKYVTSSSSGPPLEGGRLTGATIDWSLLGIGDPACDLIIAWALLHAEEKNVVRVELEVDDATWARGRGWALSIALIALPYYKDTNPVFAAVARRLISEILADPGAVSIGSEPA